MIGMGARHKRIYKVKNINHTILEDSINELNNVIEKETEKEQIRKHIINNKKNYNYRNSIISEIENNIKYKLINLLDYPMYFNTNALIYCCKNININHIKNLRKKSYAKLIKKLLELNINILSTDNNGMNGLMYLCNYITKNKYIKLIEIYLELSKKNNVLKELLNQKSKNNNDIYYFINNNISDDINIITTINKLILFYNN
jgi:hypothetical protein